ncbi:MAG: hypothetical protein AB2401_02875, partial [Bacillus sp. (in: firmicutes)]
EYQEGEQPTEGDDKEDTPEEKPKRERRSRNTEATEEEQPRERKRRQRKAVDDTPPGEDSADDAPAEDKPKRTRRRRHYADTRDEAEELVAEAKEDIYLISFQISEKHNKYGTYFLVDLKFSYDTPKEIMENAPSKKEDEPSTDSTEHEGIEYSVNNDGTVNVNTDEEEE